MTSLDNLLHRMSIGFIIIINYLHGSYSMLLESK